MKVMAIAPYEGLKELMIQVAGGEDFEFEAASGDLEKGVELAKQAEANGTDLIISRGGTAELIQQEVSIPVVDIEVSGYDMLRVLTLAKGYPGKAAIVGFPMIADGASAVCEILDIRIDACTVSDERDVEPVLLQLKEQGYQIIIGDVITIEKAEQLGLNGLLLTSGKESIAKAFAYAKKLYSFLESIKQKYAVPYHILQKAETGYAVYNKTFRPVFQNGVFAEHIGLLDNLEELIGEAEKKGVIHFRLRKHGRTWNIMGRRFFASDEALTVFTAENEKDVRISSLPGAAILSPLRMSYMETSRNETMQQVLKKAELFAARREPVWINGAPGSGKESLAGLIHMKGEDKHEPFRTIDAGLLSEAEWERACESEEFFSGRGTLYIKQVDRMPPSSQRLLLRRISEPYDGPRLIVSSYRRRAGEFSSDLYDALCHLELDVPPLYERKEDILHLAYLFIAESNEAFGKQIVGFRSEAGVLLEEAKWPGNLSQLRKTVQNCVLEAQGVYIEKADAERVLSRLNEEEREDIDLSGTLEEIEKRIIQKIYAEEGNNQTRTAERLGINRTTLWRKLKSSH
ncbi:PrpR N-terminal domain-containing protein [Bacillus haynesii]|uniref:PrpR N-terminal domain-containing protein n=1 Tax=Bacillus haynesii TaxID=1925021 RepID=UPI00227DE199|nr:sigma-54-dependent transcriptional regulator [Bacillus haynesii]MCY8370507.1 PrpR N-terminal domain-containing protein [Bacillus haynesii]